MPVFYIRSSSSNIYQIAKITNVNIKTVKYPSCELPGQHVPSRAPIQAIWTANYTAIILLQPLGSIINFKNSVLTTTQKRECSGLFIMFIVSVDLTLSLTLQKPQGTSRISFGTDKIDNTWFFFTKLILNSTGSAFGKNTITLSSTSSNSGSESIVLISAGMINAKINCSIEKSFVKTTVVMIIQMPEEQGGAQVVRE